MRCQDSSNAPVMKFCMNAAIQQFWFWHPFCSLCQHHLTDGISGNNNKLFFFVFALTLTMCYTLFWLGNLEGRVLLMEIRSDSQVGKRINLSKMTVSISRKAIIYFLPALNEDNAPAKILPPDLPLFGGLSSSINSSPYFSATPE